MDSAAVRAIPGRPSPGPIYRLPRPASARYPRNAATGSMRVARRAGAYEARTATSGPRA